MTADSDPTLLLNLASSGDAFASARLLELVYDELRLLAASYLARERRDHTLQPTALVHEAYLKLVDQTRVQWAGRAHFLAVAATMMRRILVDHARARNAVKRGGRIANERLDCSTGSGIGPVEVAEGAAGASVLDEFAGSGGVDLEALDTALKELAVLDERHARVVELRFFAGLDVPTTADVLGVSERTVKDDWRFARMWLRDRLIHATD